MFTDPQSVTYNAVAQSLPRTETAGSSSTYSKDDETFVLQVSHQETKNGRLRHLVRLDQTKVAADAFVAGISREAGASIQFVIDEPNGGQYTNAELLLLCKAGIGWMTDANVTKVLAGES